MTRTATRPDASPTLASLFNARTLPEISVDDYVKRICTYAQCSFECMVLASIYLHRLADASGLEVTAYNVHRLTIVAAMTAAKFFDDCHWDNKAFARIGGVSTREINRLELEFLFAIKFRCNVGAEEFKRVYEDLRRPECTCPFARACAHYGSEGMHASYERHLAKLVAEAPGAEVAEARPEEAKAAAGPEEPPLAAAAVDEGSEATDSDDPEIAAAHDAAVAARAARAWPGERPRAKKAGALRARERAEDGSPAKPRVRRPLSPVDAPGKENLSSMANVERPSAEEVAAEAARCCGRARAPETPPAAGVAAGVVVAAGVATPVATRALPSARASPPRGGTLRRDGPYATPRRASGEARRASDERVGGSLPRRAIGRDALVTPSRPSEAAGPARPGASGPAAGSGPVDDISPAKKSQAKKQRPAEHGKRVGAARLAETARAFPVPR